MNKILEEQRLRIKSLNFIWTLERLLALSESPFCLRCTWQRFHAHSTAPIHKDLNSNIFY